MTLLRTDYPDDARLTTTECAEASGRNRRTIVDWIRRGWLPATRYPGERGRYEVRYGDLKDILNRPAV